MTNEALTIVVSREEDGRFLAEVVQRPGLLAYGLTPRHAIRRAQVATLRLEAARLESGNELIEGLTFDFAA